MFLWIQYRDHRDHPGDRARADAGWRLGRLGSRVEIGDWRLGMEIEIGIEIGVVGLWGVVV